MDDRSAARSDTHSAVERARGWDWCSLAEKEPLCEGETARSSAGKVRSSAEWTIVDSGEDSRAGRSGDLWAFWKRVYL